MGPIFFRNFIFRHLRFQDLPAESHDSTHCAKVQKYNRAKYFSNFEDQRQIKVYKNFPFNHGSKIEIQLRFHK